MSTGKILVVDDLPDWRKTLSGLLIDQGYDVQVASSVDTALSILEKEYFRVVVLDVRLDESNEDNRDGLILMHQIKAKWPTVEVIVLTGYAEVSMAQEALNPNRNGERLAHSFLEKTQTGLLLERVKQAYENDVQVLISRGEQENVEFKSSMRWDRETADYKRSRLIIAKTIAGMMNFKGGTLLIGVDDDGNILGIEEDLKTLRKKNIDGFQLDLIAIVKDYLNIQFVEFIHPRFEVIDERQICIVSIEPSLKPVFLNSGNKKEFWLRAGNSTRQLDVEEATEYIQNHWG